MIKTNIKYCELKEYKKRFINNEIYDATFKMYINKITFPAMLKYGLVESRSRYDRRHKFKIYLNGIAKKDKEKEVIKQLYDSYYSYPILMMEILYMKEQQGLIEKDNGDLEYHFTFLQY